MPRPNKAWEQQRFNIIEQEVQFIQKLDSYEQFLKEIRESPIVLVDDVPNTACCYYMMFPSCCMLIAYSSTNGTDPTNYLWSLHGEGVNDIRSVQLQDVNHVIYGSIATATEIKLYSAEYYYDRSVKLYSGQYITSAHPIYGVDAVSQAFKHDLCREDDPFIGDYAYFQPYYYDAASYNLTSIRTLYNIWKYFNGEFRVNQELIRKFGVQGGGVYTPPELPVEELEVLNYPLRIMKIIGYGEKIEIQLSESNTPGEYQQKMLYVQTIYYIDEERVEYGEYALYKNKLIDEGIFIPYQTQYNTEKNTIFEEYELIPCNMEFKRTPGFTLNFSGGHAMYIPLGYAVDDMSTSILHRRYPEIKDQFMIIRRIQGTLIEELVPTILGFVATYVTGSAEAGILTKRAVNVVSKDRYGYLYPYIYSASWSTYVHYDFPDEGWIERMGGESVAPWISGTGAPVLDLMYPGGMLFLRTSLNDKDDSWFYQNINSTYPREPIWRRSELDRCFEILREYPDFNEQIPNVEKSTPLGYDHESGYVRPDTPRGFENYGGAVPPYRDPTFEDAVNEQWSKSKKDFWNWFQLPDRLKKTGPVRPYRKFNKLTGEWTYYEYDD